MKDVDYKLNNILLKIQDKIQCDDKELLKLKKIFIQDGISTEVSAVETAQHYLNFL